MQEKRESDLIAAGKLGDRAAIAELFERHYGSSLCVARRILRSEEDSQDAVQSAYQSAFRHLPSFRGDAAFKTWITRIVTNHCLLRLRQPWFPGSWTNLESLVGKGQLRLVSPTPTPEAFAFHREVDAAVANAAAGLPRTLCEVFRLHTIYGLTLREVAAKMHLTVPAAKARLFRANARMRESLQAVWSNALRSRLNPRDSEVFDEAA
jgi:RNA polymerase sigma-70 factor (ECF subfamily)